MSTHNHAATAETTEPEVAAVAPEASKKAPAKTEGLITVSRTKNPQGKAIVRASLANGKTVSALIAEGAHTHGPSVHAAADAIADKAEKLYPEHGIGLREDLHARLEMKLNAPVKDPDAPKASKAKKKKDVEATDVAPDDSTD